jgi:hypothetical protein
MGEKTTAIEKLLAKVCFRLMTTIGIVQLERLVAIVTSTELSDVNCQRIRLKNQESEP